MASTSLPMQKLARRLLAVEAARRIAPDEPAHEAIRVCEKLRSALTKFAGPDGFTALLSRALALAKSDVPALHNVTLRPDCSFEGLGQSTDGDAGMAIVAHFLNLLVTFVGESLTLRLLREEWPDESLD